ncbi:MAG: mechanosensitive ion channel [Rikenellaceae bacterium]|nr:mechanosensitive ion channel [Rikenellaceae bacterium]
MRIFLLMQSAEELQQMADSLSYGFTAKIKEFSAMTFDQMLQSATHGIMHLAIKLVLCLVVFYFGKKAVGLMDRLLRKFIVRRKVDPTVIQFLLNLLRVVYWILLVGILIYILGIRTTTFVALFASAGLAFGVALSGTLQNFAGGVMILLFKPFRVGDFIEAQGQSGTVIDITITNTVITTSDNKTIYLPNGATSTGVVNNYSQQPTRRVEWVFGIAYGNDYHRARSVLSNLLQQDNRVLSQPAPFIGLKELGDSSVRIVVRAWVQAADYWGVFFDLNEKVYTTFPQENLSIPFPQLEVHVHGANSTEKEGKN